MLSEGVYELAVRMANEAGTLLSTHFRRPVGGVGTKSSGIDMVSDADRESEALLRELISSHRPCDAMLGEEQGAEAGSSGLRWVIDPLDGTTNFLHGYPAWAVSIAVEDRRGALLGIVHDPCRQETFAAVRGRGATLNEVPIGVSTAFDPAHSLIATGFSYSAEARAVQARAAAQLLVAVQDVRRGGSAALDLAWLACGRVDGFYEVPLKPWDRAAGELIVREAGGTVSTLPPVHRGGDDGVLAAAPRLHDPLRGIVTAALHPAPGP
jgi:myo-inositol-1(or 4)-monophosphatase